MAEQFYDTSALVKRYVNEPGSAWVRAQTSVSAGHAIRILRVTYVEVTAAVVRRHRGGRLSAGRLTTIVGQLRHDLGSRIQMVEVTPSILTAAVGVAESHGLRAYDAVQLAGALAVSRAVPGGITLVSADLELNIAAAAEGLLVEDPNAHP